MKAYIAFFDGDISDLAPLCGQTLEQVLIHIRDQYGFGQMGRVRWDEEENVGAATPTPPDMEVAPMILCQHGNPDLSMASVESFRSKLCPTCLAEYGDHWFETYRRQLEAEAAHAAKADEEERWQTPDPEDDKIEVWELDIENCSCQVVWGFWGWHWRMPEHLEEQGTIPGCPKPLYDLAMEE